MSHLYICPNTLSGLFKYLLSRATFAGAQLFPNYLHVSLSQCLINHALKGSSLSLWFLDIILSSYGFINGAYFFSVFKIFLSGFVCQTSSPLHRCFNVINSLIHSLCPWQPRLDHSKTIFPLLNYQQLFWENTSIKAIPITSAVSSLTLFLN